MLNILKPVSYTHLDVYKRQQEFHKNQNLNLHSYCAMQTCIIWDPRIMLQKPNCYLQNCKEMEPLNPGWNGWKSNPVF